MAWDHEYPTYYWKWINRKQLFIIFFSVFYLLLLDGCCVDSHLFINQLTKQMLGFFSSTKTNYLELIEMTNCYGHCEAILERSSKILVIQFGTYCIHQTQFIEFIHFVTLFSICMRNPWLNQNSMAMYPLSAGNFVRCYNYIGQSNSNSHSTQHLLNSNANKKKCCVFYFFFFFALFYFLLRHNTKLNYRRKSVRFSLGWVLVKFTGSLIFNCLCCVFCWAHVRSDCNVLGKWSKQPRRCSLLYER